MAHSELTLVNSGCISNLHTVYFRIRQYNVGVLYVTSYRTVRPRLDMTTADVCLRV